MGWVGYYVTMFVMCEWGGLLCSHACVVCMLGESIVCQAVVRMFVLECVGVNGNSI